MGIKLHFRVLEKRESWPFQYTVEILAGVKNGVTIPGEPVTLKIDSVKPLEVGLCYDALYDEIPVLLPIYEYPTHTITNDIESRGIPSTHQSAGSVP